MRIELPYITVTVDDGVRDRLAHVGERLRLTLTAYLRNAADDVDGLGRRASAARGQARRLRDDRRQGPRRDRAARGSDAEGGVK